MAGCGTGLDERSNPPSFVSSFGADTRVDGRQRRVSHIVLDWSGGKTRIYPNQTFAGVDLSLFATTDGGTLADYADHFQERVRDEVSAILEDLTWVQCDVQNESTHSGHSGDDRTLVLLTQALHPRGGGGVGEGEYDPCDEEADSEAVIFGESLMHLAAAVSFDEWVLIFANTCAHEIGHTLGFGHVHRDEFLSLGRPLYVELMLDGHTVSELQSPQRFVIPQDHCSTDAKIGVMGAIAHRCPSCKSK